MICLFLFLWIVCLQGFDMWLANKRIDALNEAVLNNLITQTKIVARACNSQPDLD